MVELHKVKENNSLIYILLDSNEKVIIHPTKYLNLIRKNHRSENSQRQIAYVLKLHCNWIEKSPCFHGMSIDESLIIINREDIIDWINDQRKMGLNERTVHNREALVREMYKWLMTKNVSARQDTPWIQKYYTKQPHNKPPRFLTSQQLIVLLNGMHNESQRVAAHFMFDTGVRVSELIRLNRSCLPNESDYPESFNYYPLTVLGSKSHDGNKYKMRETIISRPMLARIRRYHATTAYSLSGNWKIQDMKKPLFLNVHGESLSRQSVYNTIKAAWKRQHRNPRDVSPHRLRHGAAFSVLRSELGNEMIDNLIILRGMLGHESIKTTEIYAPTTQVTLYMLDRLQHMHLRYEEADEIYRKTYLPEFRNIQKRGRCI